MLTTQALGMPCNKFIIILEYKVNNGLEEYFSMVCKNKALRN